MTLAEVEVRLVQVIAQQCAAAAPEPRGGSGAAELYRYSGGKEKTCGFQVS